jgi:general stress protein 26
MVVVKIDDNGEVLVATSLRSEAQEIETEHQVALTFQFAMACVTVSGHARIVTDRAIVKATWNEAMRAGFPGGAEDTALCLIQVCPVTGEYWDMRGMKKIRTLFEATRASSTGATRSPSRTSTWSSPRDL